MTIQTIVIHKDKNNVRWPALWYSEDLLRFIKIKIKIN